MQCRPPRPMVRRPGQLSNEFAKNGHLSRRLDRYLELHVGGKLSSRSTSHIDPPSGETDPVKGVAIANLFMTQSYAALWRLARYLAHQHFTPALADAVTDPLVFALVTYVLAAGAVTIPHAAQLGSSTMKNAFPQ